MKNKIVIKKTRINIIDFLKSSKFGAFLLICSTILEGFYAYRLFNLTGYHTFEALTFLVSLIYAALVTGVIVFFALRNNFFIVWVAVCFELTMNTLLDVQTVAILRPEHWIWVFISQLAIGSILPLSTKAFADEVNKRVLSRNIKTNDNEIRRTNATTRRVERKTPAINKARNKKLE
jgi:hypothetical protein